MASSPNPRQRLAALHRHADVRRANFDNQDLASARTSQLRFTHCSFVAADLRHASLDGCFFRFCDLTRADLRGASLRGVHFAGCTLRDADLRDADLTAARFGRVLTGTPPHGLTDLTGARVRGATLRDVGRDAVLGWPHEADAVGPR